MNNSNNTYIVHPGDAVGGLNFLFVSKGNPDVIKVVNYAYVEKLNETVVYNLGFGDVDLTTGDVIDSVKTGNGDARKVFNTVLSTVPLFFERFPGCRLMVKGSDSRPEFKDECRRVCKKKCNEDHCRKSNQRIRIYRNFVDLNFEVLNIDYQFFGRFEDVNGVVYEEDYVAGKEYVSVAVVKRKA